MDAGFTHGTNRVISVSRIDIHCAHSVSKGKDFDCAVARFANAVCVFLSVEYRLQVAVFSSETADNQCDTVIVRFKNMLDGNAIFRRPLKARLAVCLTSAFVDNDVRFFHV